MAELSQRGRDVHPQVPRSYDGATRDDAGLKTLLRQLNEDASQFVHDELDLAKLELREVAGALSSEVREVGQTLAKDLAKIGVALSLALMGGLALSAGVLLAIGSLLGGAFWAGGLIVGVVLLAAAGFAAKSAASDVQKSKALRLAGTKRTIQRDKQVLADEVRETKKFAQREAQEFKDHVSGSTATHHHH